MASTALNARVLEAMVTSRPPETTSSSNSSTSSPMNGQEVSTSYLAQYTATLQDFARRSGELMAAGAGPAAPATLPPQGDDGSTEDEDNSGDDNSSGGGQKSSVSSPLDSLKKRRKQSKPNKIEGSEGGSVEAEEGGQRDEEQGREEGTEEDQSMDDSGECNEQSEHEKTLLNSTLRCPHCQFLVVTHDDLRRHIIEEHIGRMLNDEEILLRHAQQAKQRLLEQQHHHLQQYQQHVLAETIRLQEEQRRRENQEHEINTTEKNGHQHQQQHHHSIQQKQQQQQLQPQNLLQHHQQQQHQHQNQLQQHHLQHQHQEKPHNQQQQQLQQQQQQQQQQKQQQLQPLQHHQHLQKEHLFPEREEGETGPLNLSSPRWDGVRSSQSRELQRSPGTPLPASIPMPPSFADARFNLPGLLPFGPPHFLLPFMHHGERENPLTNGSQPGSFIPGQSRIFNLEAFCDLCNKEFCNKYFLKTHKANKHGIFTPELSCSPMPPTPPTPLGPSTTPLGQSAPLLTPLIHSPITPTSISGSPYAGAFLTANLSNLAALRPPHPNVMPVTPKSSTSMKTESTSMSKSGVINLDAYCELCQKEFCNKYFLKRHKLKIHGVNIEVTIKSPKNNPALDRPEGWCDACRRDIGSRSSLNAHKLHTHGPHIVNNIVTPEPSVRHPMDFRPLNSLPIKLSNNDREVKDNFSPWDVMRERDTLENNSSWNKRPNAINDNIGLKQDHNPSGLNNLQEKRLMENLDFEDKSNSSPSQQNMATSEVLNDNSPRMFLNNPMLSPHFEDIRKVKLPQPIGMNGEDADPVCIKVEDKFINETTEESTKPQHDAESDPPMPILKPQTETLREINSCNDANDQEERPPPLLKEQITQPNRIEEEDAHENGQNITDPPRTPGGVSNSTDDSSREAGIIARVGQPAIVQAPPGTKFTPEQLRQLGVINPDAFCELCCKEFCNKYFLRTHRIKKHNIYTPEYSERSKQQFKDSPSINLAKIFERQALEFRPPNLQEPDLELECDICRRPFPSPYLLHMHKFYFHGAAHDGLHAQHNMTDQIPPQEQLRRLALQAHHQKMQDHHQLLLRQHKHQQQQLQQQQELQRQHQAQHQQQQEQHRQRLQQHLEMQEYQRVKYEHEPHTDKADRYQNDNYDRVVKPESSDQEDKVGQESPRLTKTPQASPGLPENSNGSVGGEADTSQELRKLQSMILELNRQDEDGIHCKICQKDIGNKYFLRAHMMTEHGILLQEEHSSESAQTPKTPYDANGRINSPLSSSASDSQAYCDLCKKDFFSRFILQQHMLTAHGIFTQQQGPTSFLDRIRAEVEGREERKPQSVSRSFCEICNKELCNKYFMKTHMLKMHGINIENGNSGGVTCDICDKELCSKYFLKVHRQNTHGLVEDIRDSKDIKDGIIKERKEGEETLEDTSAIEICPLCNRKFKNIKWLRTHLTQDHGEDGKAKWRQMETTLPHLELLSRSTPRCSICGQAQQDVVSLQLHLIKHHGSSKPNEDIIGENIEQMLQCSACSFVCRSPALLSAHEQSHTPTMTPLTPHTPPRCSPILCTVCPQLLPNIETYQQHFIGHQLQGLFEPLLAKSQGNQTVENTMKNSFTTQMKKKSRRRWRCRKCDLSFKNRSCCLVHVFSQHSKRPPSIMVTKQWSRKIYKCRICNVSERRLGDLITHMRIHCKKPRVPSLPLAHARPADPSIDQKDFVMQSFLMNKEDERGSGEHEEGNFVPSFVQLPVARRVHRTLTVSFTLTPA